jgi:hypothetical protein
MRSKWFIASAVAALSVTLFAQTGSRQQAPASRGSWPCGGRVDASYFNVAEGTGGHIFLLAPFELADSAPLLLAVDRHPQTIFRLAGSITPGVHEFRIPIDGTVESVLFSISVQCLQNADILGPSGVPATGDGVADYSNFRAERMTVVEHPQVGTWTIRAGGSGIAGVMVQARSDIALANVEFAPASGTAFSTIPSAGVENLVRFHVRGDVQELQASIVNGSFKTLARLPLTADENERTYTARFTPGSAGFRIAITGRDAQGLPFQRVAAPLLTAR